MRSWIVFSTMAAFPTVMACTTAFNTDTGGSDNAGGDTTTSSTTGTGAKSSSSTGAGASSTSSSGKTTTSSSGGAQCPTERGAYTVTDLGPGCTAEQIDTDATVCVGQSGCDITIATAGGAAPALSSQGTITIGPLGDFSGAAVTQGNTAHTGCFGAWDAVGDQLTVVCGASAAGPCTGMSTQCCAVTLKPKSGGGC